MFDENQVTEAPELRELRESLEGVDMPARPSLESIMARGRTHRRHRHSGVAGLFVAGAAAGAALTVALAGGGTSQRGTVTTLTQRSHHAPREIKTDAYTLISDTSGKVKLTIHLGKLFDPARLQSDLARVGIPAKVTDGRFCTSDPEPSGLSRIVSTGTGGRQSITFDPAAIPAGTELSFGRFRLEEKGAQMGVIALIDAGSYRCTKSLTDVMDGDRLGYARIPAGPATSHG